MRATIVAVVAGLSLMTAAVRMSAHHAFTAEFDANKPIRLQGTIAKVEWVNPHTWFHIEVNKPNGKTETWMIEAGTPNTLLRQGLTKSTVKVGTIVIVDGFQSKDASLKGSGRDLTLPDGRKLFMGSQGAGTPPGR
jgi:hypothetical protein